mgnify:CR=1 FL=1
MNDEESHPEPAATARAARTTLRSLGLKSTGPREIVFRVLSELEREGRHGTAEYIYRRLQDAGAAVGPTTVYRILRQFEDAGLVVRHQFAEAAGVYELTPPQHHDHMVDVDTGRIVEFQDEVIERRQRELAAAHGYDIVRHSLTLYVRARRVG